MYEDILAMASRILDPSSEEAPVLQSLCHAAWDRLMARLPDPELAEARRSSLICAAALQASADLLACRGSQLPTRLSAGEVTLENQAWADASLGLRQAAENILASLGMDGGFVFRGVTG